MYKEFEKKKQKKNKDFSASCIRDPSVYCDVKYGNVYLPGDGQSFRLTSKHSEK